MKRRKRRPEEIITKLRQADGLLAEGAKVPEVAKSLGVTEAHQCVHRTGAIAGMKAIAGMNPPDFT